MLRESLSREKLIFFVIIPILVMTNLLLLRQNVQLRGRFSEDYSQLDMLQPGDQAVPFQAELLRGGQIQVAFPPGGQRWVLLYFSPRCRYSYEQFPYWRSLIEHGQASNIRVVGLVSEHEDPQQVKRFLRSMGAASLEVARIPDAVHRQYKLLVTPLTLTLSSQGKVEKKWIGRWGFSTIREVAQMLNLD